MFTLKYYVMYTFLAFVTGFFIRDAVYGSSFWKSVPHFKRNANNTATGVLMSVWYEKKVLNEKWLMLYFKEHDVC
jgi:hypothetical protein